MNTMADTGILALEDGSVFSGISFGATKTVVGEAVFNTGMTGYQEILTDPSYHGQIVVMTTPQIGNYGINPDDEESDGPKLNGFAIHEISPIASNWRSRQSLADYLAERGVPGISGIDTRRLTKQLRVKGALRCCLSTEGIPSQEAIRRAQDWSGLTGVDYVNEVTCAAPYLWDKEGINCAPFTVEGTALRAPTTDRRRRRIIAYDFGAKRNIFRKLAWHGFTVEVVPANTPAEYVRERNPNGVFLSNGPGDPAAVSYAHAAVKQLLPHYPIFGICLGHQIITHALGAETCKLRFGHHGSNHPVRNCETGKVAITAQNHGFACLPEALEQRGAVVTEINLNDGTVEGLRHRELPVFSVQYHPEAAPGPHDAEAFFEAFYQLINRSAS